MLALQVHVDSDVVRGGAGCYLLAVPAHTTHTWRQMFYKLLKQDKVVQAKAKEREEVHKLQQVTVEAQTTCARFVLTPCACVCLSVNRHCRFR